MDLYELGFYKDPSVEEFPAAHSKSTFYLVRNENNIYYVNVSGELYGDEKLYNKLRKMCGSYRGTDKNTAIWVAKIFAKQY